MKAASGFTGLTRAAKADGASRGWSTPAAGGQQGAAAVPLGWGTGIMLNHRTTLLIYRVPPGARRPPGMSHLLTADSAALARSSLPRERTRRSHVLPPLPSHTLRRSSFPHVSQASLSSLQLLRQSCQMCQRSGAQRDYGYR